MIKIAKAFVGVCHKEISSISLCKFFELVESSYFPDVFLPDLSLPRLSKLLIVQHCRLTSMPISLFYRYQKALSKVTNLILELEVRR